MYRRQTDISKEPDQIMATNSFVLSFAPMEKNDTAEKMKPKQDELVFAS